MKFIFYRIDKEHMACSINYVRRILPSFKPGLGEFPIKSRMKLERALKLLLKDNVSQADRDKLSAGLLMAGFETGKLSVEALTVLFTFSGIDVIVNKRKDRDNSSVPAIIGRLGKRKDVLGRGEKLVVAEEPHFIAKEIREMSAAEVQLLTTRQIYGLITTRGPDLSKIHALKIEFLTDEQLFLQSVLFFKSLAQHQVRSLSPEQIKALAPFQIAAIKAGYFGPRQLAALSEEQIVNICAVPALTSSQIRFLAARPLTVPILTVMFKTSSDHQRRALLSVLDQAGREALEKALAA